MVKFEITEVIKASRSKVFEHFSKVEDLPKLHPDYVKALNVVSRDNNTVIYDVENEIKTARMTRKLNSRNKLISYPEERIEIETLDGSGKGSKVILTFMEVEEGTKVDISAELKLGLLVKFLPSKPEDVTRKMLEQDKSYLESQ